MDTEISRPPAFHAQEFQRGYAAGFKEALLKAMEVVRVQRWERGRSDVNAAKVLAGIAALDEP